MDNIKITRKELYDLVWSTPMITLAKKYFISDNGLRKICKRMSIPLPKAGHWEKIKAGKKGIIEVLSLDYNGKEELELSLRPEGDNTIEDPPSDIEILQKEIESDPNISLEIPDKLLNPDEIIIQLKRKFDESAKKKYLMNGVFTIFDPIKVSVSPTLVNRTLLFMDTLIKAVKKRGHTITCRGRETYIVIENQEIEISLREKTKRVKKQTSFSWDSYEYIPVGILNFTIKAWFQNIDAWQDGKISIEKWLSNIIASLEIAAKKLKEWKSEVERKKEEGYARERLKLAQKQVVDKEISDFNTLLSQAKRWKDAEVIREYIKFKEENLKVANKSSDELVGWIDWATKKANWYDPNVNAIDELLGVFGK
jgi:hypothetical protein